MMKQSQHATISAVARFLGWQRQDVGRAIEQDGLPAVDLPTAAKMTRKVYLPAFHQWWLSRAKNANETMRSYDEFRRMFEGGADA